MKEITRIHLAKTPYDIELTAKKDLEGYLTKLTNYAEDSEIVEDIEIRMTEILEERGVKAGGVISQNDVTALEQQIGAAEEIAGDEVVVENDTPAERKLYRDTDKALVGGVISGLATYFKIDVVLARIIFVVLTLITSGLLLIGYAFMWLIIPPAKTTADRLRLNGKPVTLAAIKQSSRGYDNTDVVRRREISRRVIFGTFGLMSVAISVGALVLTAIAAVQLLLFENPFEGIEPTTMWITVIVASIAGVLLSILFGLISYMLFKQKFNKKLAITSLVVIFLGLVSFGTAVGLGSYESWRSHENIMDSIEKEEIQLPAGFSDIKSAEFSFKDSYPASIDYVVDDRSRMILEAVPGFKTDVKLDGTHAIISLESELEPKGYAPANLKIYGPALEQLTLNSGTLSYTADNQQTLEVNVRDDADLTLMGEINGLTAATGQDSGLYMRAAGIGDGKLDIKPGSDLQLGNIRSLEVAYANFCPTDGRRAEVTVGHIAAGNLKLNGETKSLESYDLPCLEFTYENQQ